MNQHLFGVLLSTMIALAGCGNANDRDAGDPQGDSRTSGDSDTKNALILGSYDEETFRPFVQGETLNVVHGFQGGTWVHISIRARDVDPQGTLTASLSENIGVTELNVTLTPTSEGFLEIHNIAIPIYLGILTGREVIITASYVTAKQTISASIQVLLVDR